MEPLTVEQKAALCLGADMWHTAGVPGIASIMLTDGPHCLRAQPGAGDHAGIGGSDVPPPPAGSDVPPPPAGSDVPPPPAGSDVPPPPAGSLPATYFPTAAVLASSWDPELAREIDVALGEEARAQRVAVVLGPGVNT